MSTWLVILIVVGIVLAVGALVYVVWRWGDKKAAITKISLTAASAVFSVLQDVFKDKPDDLDAHDFMLALESLSRAGLDAVKKKEAGGSFMEIADDLKKRVKEIAGSFPKLKDSVTDEMVDKAVQAAMVLISSIPKVSDVIKK